MDEWVQAVAKALGVSADVDTAAILDVAREAAHAVDRPAAPVSAYLMGLAVAQGMDADEAVRRVSALAHDWPPVT